MFVYTTGHCAQLTNTCIRQYASINCICFIINIWKYSSDTIVSALESKEALKKSLDYVEWKSAQCLQSFRGGATQEAEERPTPGSAWPTYSMFPLSGSNFTLSVPFSLDFIWIFKVYYQVFELQTLTLLKSSFISLFFGGIHPIFCVHSEHTEVVNDVMHTT